MKDNGRDSSIKTLYKQTSQHMAELIWKQFTKRYPNKLDDCDYLMRLRTAHALLLQFHQVYFNRQHNAPTEDAQTWLIRRVLNECNYQHWPTVS